MNWNDATLAVLAEHQETQDEEKARIAYSDQGLVIAQSDGSPFHPASLTKAFARRVKAAELPSIRLHDLRHTWASVALAAGVHPKVVSERLGHASITITLDTYSHVIPTLQREAAEQVAALIVGTS